MPAMKTLFSRPLASGLLCCLTTILGAASPDFTVHEWGTFTSIYASDGRMLTGLELEEEPLPGFAYSHVGMLNGGRADPDSPQVTSYAAKGWQRPLANVTVKMETPVLYFYGDTGFTADVRVAWHGGSISQWYPQRSGGETPPAFELKREEGQPVQTVGGEIDFAQGYEGSIEWQVEVEPPLSADLFKPGETLTWLYPRVPDANILRAGEETEGFLFYRGVGNFQPQVDFSIDAEGALHMANDYADSIPFALVIEHDGSSMRVYEANGLPAGEQLSIAETDWEKLNWNEWRDEIYHRMSTGLARSGLTIDEARAMTRTWWRSYFETPLEVDGVNCPRVFWVMPSAAVEEILPLQIEPKPQNIIRVLVGRAEILRPAAEVKLREQAQSGVETGRFNLIAREFWAQTPPRERLPAP